MSFFFDFEGIVILFFPANSLNCATVHSVKLYSSLFSLSFEISVSPDVLTSILLGYYKYYN
jgi:hypothetical protein